MALRPYPGFVGPTYTVQNPIAANDDVYNWMPSKIESGTGPAQYVYDPTPGFEQYCTTGADPIRGFFTLNGGSFAVSGEDLYELPTFSGGTAILRASGLNNPDDSMVMIAGNGDAGHQLMLTAGSLLYVFDLLTNTLTYISDIPNASAVVFQDGYFIALDPNTSTIYLSALEDGTSWDLLDAAQRNDTPDKWQTMIVRPKEVWLPGSQSCSVYYDDGNADFPFVPNPSVAIPYGIAAPNSLALLYGSPIWLANDLTVRYANGYTMQRVSTHAVEFAIAQYAQTSQVSDADAFTYDEQGHACYVLNFPTANVTWVFDLVSGLWHKRGSWNGLTFDVLPVRGHIFANNAHLVGSRTDGTVYQMSQDFSTDIDGTGLRRVRRAPHLVQGLQRIRYAQFRLHMEVGIGLSTGQGSDPLMMLRWSDDGGQTFNEPINMPFGRIGQYGVLVDWWHLGQGRDRIFEVSCSEPVPARLVQALLRYSVGAS